MKKSSARQRAGSVQKALKNIETDRQHHLTGPFLPPTPIGSRSSTPNTSNFNTPNEYYESKGIWNDIRTLRWLRAPSSSFKMLMIPIILYLGCAAVGIEPNPFTPMLFISHYIPESSPDDPRYRKGWLDLVFIAYHIIVFSFIRQFTLLKIIHPIARRLGIKKQAKLDRFGEQAYAVLYYGVMGIWGLYVMKKLPTWWYRTEYYWIDYPHWQMLPSLKRYYLTHFSYWIQQLFVLVLKIEKPRKDYNELAAHHIVTLWLIGWSYGLNLTLIGNAIYVSMDIPDVFLAASKLLNYLNLDTAKMVSFAVFLVIWTYFRHWLNLVILHSVWTQFDLIPDEVKFFRPWEGVWMAWWMKYQIFVPILLLQLLNLFWYFLCLRILYRGLFAGDITDDRSDDEDDGDNEDDKKED